MANKWPCAFYLSPIDGKMAAERKGGFLDEGRGKGYNINDT